MTHRIQTLEEHLGQDLLQRSGRGVELTAFGIEYAAVVGDALSTLASFPLKRDWLDQPSRIRVAMPPTFARLLFIPRLAQFTASRPNIQIEISLSVPLYGLSFGESDVEVRFGAGKYPRYIAEKLFNDTVICVASPAYLAKTGPLARPADLRKAVLLQCALDPWQPWFAAAELHWPEPSSPLRTDDLGLAIDAVRYGYGVGLLRRRFAKPFLSQGEMIQLFDVELQDPEHAYYLTYEKAALRRKDLCEFIEWFTSSFQDN